MNKLLSGVLGIFFLCLVGCSDSNVDLVKDGYFFKYPHTTIGKAFSANFDNCKWRTEESKLGTTYVIFTGRINKRLHSLVADRFVLVAENETRGNIDNIRNYIHRFPKMLIYSFNVPDWEKILTAATGEYDNKYASITQETKRTQQEIDARARRGEGFDNRAFSQTKIDEGQKLVALKGENSDYFEQQLKVMIDEYVCPVGAEISIKWQIDVDGTSFEFKEFTGDGILAGTSFEAFLKFIYTE